MEELNRRGGMAPAVLSGDVPLLAPPDMASIANELLIDTREPEGFASGHIAGAYSIWMGGLPVFGGWVAKHDTPIYLITESDDDVDQAVLHLSRIGIDGVVGALGGGFSAWRKSGQPIERTHVITPRELREQPDDIQLLDVFGRMLPRRGNRGQLTLTELAGMSPVPRLFLTQRKFPSSTINLGWGFGLSGAGLSIVGHSGARAQRIPFPPTRQSGVM